MTNTPEANKAAIVAQDRNLKAVLLLTKETLIAEAKATAKTIARAEAAISKAGLALMEKFYDEGGALADVVHDYDKDIAPITQAVIAEAYAASSEGSKKTWRAYAKIFFLAGAHGIEPSDATGIAKIVETYRDLLKRDGVIAEHGNDKPKGRAPRPASNKPATPVAPNTDTAPQANVAPSDATLEKVINNEAPPRWRPGKAITEQDKKHAALILCGNPGAALKIIKAFDQHREQVLKYISQLIASDEEVK